MENKPLLPPSLMKVEHIAPFDPIIRNLIGSDTDLTGEDPVWGYPFILNIDTVQKEMLPYLAEMFGVDGFKGMDFAATEQAQRDTVYTAPLMHRRHGTPWTLQTALENAGFRNVAINEYLDVQYLDGSILLDGSVHLNSNDWADFTVTLDPPAGVLPSAVDMDALVKLINWWKRNSLRLVGVYFNSLVITSFSVGNSSINLLDGSHVLNGGLALD